MKGWIEIRRTCKGKDKMIKENKYVGCMEV